MQVDNTAIFEEITRAQRKVYHATVDKKEKAAFNNTTRALHFVSELGIRISQ
jgi:hypothetical protein